jgi:hypothetical protein
MFVIAFCFRPAERALPRAFGYIPERANCNCQPPMLAKTSSIKIALHQLAEQRFRMISRGVAAANGRNAEVRRYGLVT